MCHIFEVSRSGYYQWLKRTENAESSSHELLDEKIKKSFEQSRGTYGSPRIVMDLRDEGIQCSQSQVARRMKRLKIKAKTKRKFKATTDSSHALPVSPNLLNRNFSTQSINEKWVGDITYIRTEEGWLYLATIIDLHSRKVIGWSMSNRMKKQLVCDALLMALWSRKFPKGVMIHHDRGSQYCSYRYQHILKTHELLSSMSRRGNCWDNCVAESFFKTLKVECIYGRTFKTRKEAKQVVFEYIEVFYNQRRRHSAIDFNTPVEVEYKLLEAA